MILTGHVGSNAELIARVGELYLKPNYMIADVTFGKGNFWSTIKLPEGAKLHGFDIEPKFADVQKADLRKNPAANGLFDVVVLDPPYMHGGATVKKSIEKCYGNRHTKYSSHGTIMKLYADGIREAWRVLKVGGTLWVKCQDEIESGRQRWSHLEILQIAQELLFYALDLFVLVQSTIPARRLPYQKHARKNHSYLWIFRKERLKL